MNFGLPESTIARMTAVLREFPDVEEAVIYGSRAKGTYKPGSDIDLALIGTALTEPLRGRIEEGFEELLLPYSIDLSVLAHLENPDLVDHIHRVGRRFYSRSEPV